MRVVTTLLCAALLAVPSAALGQDEEAKAAIAEILVAWETGWNAGDGAAIAALYSDDAKLLPPGGEPVEGHDAIQAFWQGAIDEAGTTVDLQSRELKIFGDAAVEVGSFVDTDADGGHVDHGKYIVLLKKVDGSWKLVRDIWNSSMTP